MDHAEAVLPVAQELLRALDPPRPVRLLGVRVAGMEPREPIPAAVTTAGQLDLGV